MIVTLVLDADAVRARVKRAHITPLERTLRAKKSCYGPWLVFLFMGTEWMDRVVLEGKCWDLTYGAGDIFRDSL